MSESFRSFLYDPQDERVAALRGLDAYTYRDVAANDDFTGGLIKGWEPLYRNEFRGVTHDGVLIEDLYALGRPDVAERAPTTAILDAAERLLAVLSPDQRAQIQYAVDAVEWQTWANPEFLQFDTGLRLENVNTDVRDAFFELVAASTSAAGYDAIRTMMRINHFLGDIVDLLGIMNEFSYNIALYGEPSATAPWGWQLYGHHCAVNCLVIDGQMVMSPVFLGAEPNEIDAGPHAGATVFTRRIELGRTLMGQLDEQQRERATSYAELVDPAMPAGRVHPGDERHLAGAFQDNRVIPYEGITVAELDPAAAATVWDIVADFVSILPDGPAAARLREAQQYAEQTWFSWIGPHGRTDPFYYRIQSPVIIAELDHHCGVFLTNDTPQPFHIHTVLRTPNGNDYGRSLVREWQARQ